MAVQIYALETPRDWLFRARKVHLLIEYVNGRTLDTVTRLSVPRLVQVFERIASGLALNDSVTLLAGAIPAAALALIVQAAFELGERRFGWMARAGRKA